MCELDYTDYDFEPFEFEGRRFQKTRKPRKCDLCGRAITPGEMTLVQASKSDGDFSSERVCKQCGDIAEDFFKEHSFFTNLSAVDHYIDECVERSREERDAAAVRKWAKAQRAISRRHVPLGGTS